MADDDARAALRDLLLKIGLVVGILLACGPGEALVGCAAGGRASGVLQSAGALSGALMSPLITEPLPRDAQSSRTVRVGGCLPLEQIAGTEVVVAISQREGDLGRELAKVPVSNDRSWKVPDPVTLEPGANYLRAWTLQSGKRSEPSILRLWQGGADPATTRALKIVEPSDGAWVGSDVTVKGEARAGQRLLLKLGDEERRVRPSVDGTWELHFADAGLSLASGVNTISVRYEGGGETVQVQVSRQERLRWPLATAADGQVSQWFGRTDFTQGANSYHEWIHHFNESGFNGRVRVDSDPGSESRLVDLAGHDGLDLAGGGVSKPVYAAADGEFSYDVGDGFGWIVHNGAFESYITVYGHIIPTDWSNQKPDVKTGKDAYPKRRVTQGSKIGDTAEVGNTTGYHLHFSVFRNGDPVNVNPQQRIPPDNQRRATATRQIFESPSATATPSTSERCDPRSHQLTPADQWTGPGEDLFEFPNGQSAEEFWASVTIQDLDGTHFRCVGGR